MVAFKYVSAVAFFATAASLLASGGPAAAHYMFSQNGGSVESNPDDKSAGDVDVYLEKLNSRDYRGALLAADRLRNDARLSEIRPYLEAMRAAALLGLDRKGESEAAFRLAREADPQNSDIEVLRFEIALMTKNIDVALEALDRMIAIAPDDVRQIDSDVIFYLLRSGDIEGKTAMDDRRIALAKLGYGGRNVDGDYLASIAIDTLIERRDLASAADLLTYIDEPKIIEDMLVQKKYQALWPKLEAMAGPGLAKVRISSLKTAEQAFADEPSDLSLQRLAQAYRHSKRPRDAIALNSRLPDSAEQLEKTGEDMGWAFNNIAFAYADLGMLAESDGLFARLNEASIENPRWRVSMIINRLELLVANGNYGQAAALLDTSWDSAEKHGSPYARQLVRQLRYCTLIGLGRRDEASRGLPDLLNHTGDTRHATIEALLCGRNLEKAEEVALSGMDDDSFQRHFVRSLQPVRLTGDNPSVWTEQWKQLRARPAIAAIYDRLARDMPAQFLTRD